jgi:hypothetical protein
MALTGLSVDGLGSRMVIGGRLREPRREPLPTDVRLRWACASVRYTPLT